MSYYMVRAYRNQFNEFFDSDVVAEGWSEVDFSACSNANELIERIRQEYGYLKDCHPTTRGRHLAAIRRFKSIQKGDKILVPYWSSIVLATATGEENYNGKLKYPIEQANQHRVEYHRDKDGNVIPIPRRHLSEGLQRRLRVQGSTVSDLR